MIYIGYFERGVESTNSVNRINWRVLLRFTAIPLALILFFGLFVTIYRLLGLPTSEELIELAKAYYLQYGYLIVFLGALAEGLLAVNYYLPGSFVIVLGVTFNQGHLFAAAALVGLAMLGFFLTYIVDYALGRYGWYRFLLFLGLGSYLKKMEQRVERHGLPIIFSTYFHPNIGALTATAAGMLQLPFRQFLVYSALATFGWNALWGTVVYFLGPAALDFLTVNVWLLIIPLVIWLVIGFIRAFSHARRKEEVTSHTKIITPKV